MLLTARRHSRASRSSRLAAALLTAGTCAALMLAPGSAQAIKTKFKIPAYLLPASAKPQPNNPGNVGKSVAPKTTYAPQSTTSTQPGGAVTSSSAATTTSTTTTAAGAATTAPPSATKPAQGTKTTTHARGRSTKLSAPALALAILAALLALACTAWGVARLTAYEPRWFLSARHALAEGGFRASATWAEFADWARLGK